MTAMLEAMTLLYFASASSGLVFLSSLNVLGVSLSITFRQYSRICC